MIDAELRGKSAAEDCLTSSALGLLALLPDYAFISFLRRARGLDGARLQLDDHAGLEDEKVEFWPWLPKAGEPDAIVTFCEDGRRHVVLIEAKRGAPQSKEHQVGEYALGLQRERGHGEKLSAVYLTTDKLMPEEELRKEYEFFRARADQGDLGFYWLSWTDLYVTIRQWLRRVGLPLSEKRICYKLVLYLGELGYGRFDGFSVKSENLTQVRLFWKGKGLLAMPSTLGTHSYRRRLFEATLGKGLLEMPSTLVMHCYRRRFFEATLRLLSEFWKGVGHERQV